ncbi:MAG: sulfotransferase [Pseudomonadota bacterium]
MAAPSPTVVLLLSDKRSGSTMFQDELCRHSSIQHVAYSPHTYHETQHWLKAAALLNRPAALFAGGKVYATYQNRSTARTYMEDLLRGNLPDFELPAEDRDLVYEGWDALCTRYAEPVFFEKSPQFLAHWAALSLILDWMATTRFRVKLIGLVRNPLAVQYSAKELFSTEAETRQFGWLDIQRNLLALQSVVPPEDFMLMRYEEILADAPARFAEVCEFIGIEPDPAIGSAVHGNSLEKWRADESYTLQLDPAVRQMAEALGYSEQALDNPNLPDPSKRSTTTAGQRIGRLRNRAQNQILKPAYLRLRHLSRGGR